MSRGSEFRVYPPAPHIRVSRDGRIQSNLMRGPKLDRDGPWKDPKIQGGGKTYRYPFVSVKSTDGKFRPVKVHQIVAACWLDPPSSPGMIIRHLDDNRMNYHADNLAWGTAKENSEDAKRNGRLTSRRLTSEQHQEIRLERLTGTSLEKLAVKYGVTIGSIRLAAQAPHVPHISKQLRHMLADQAAERRRKELGW